MLPRPTRFRPTTYPERTHMEHAYRKFRKYGGSVIIATQSVQDLYGNSVDKAISSNSANMFLLGQKPTTLEQVRKDNQLVTEDWVFNMLKSGSGRLLGNLRERWSSSMRWPLDRVGLPEAALLDRSQRRQRHQAVSVSGHGHSGCHQCGPSRPRSSPALLRKKGRPSEEGRP